MTDQTKSRVSKSKSGANSASTAIAVMLITNPAAKKCTAKTRCGRKKRSWRR